MHSDKALKKTSFYYATSMKMTQTLSQHAITRLMECNKNLSMKHMVETLQS